MIHTLLIVFEVLASVVATAIVFHLGYRAFLRTTNPDSAMFNFVAWCFIGVVVGWFFLVGLLTLVALVCEAFRRPDLFVPVERAFVQQHLFFRYFPYTQLVSQAITLAALLFVKKRSWLFGR